MVRSASRIISTSPRASAKPLRTASPLPLPVCLNALMSQLRDRPRSRAAISSQVPSLLSPSTKMISMLAAEPRHAPDRGLDVAALVAAGHDDGDREQSPARLRLRPRDHVVAQAELADERQRRDEAVDQPAEAEQPERRQQPPLALDDVEVREIEQVGDVLARQPVLRPCRRGRSEAANRGEQRLPEPAEID